MAFLGALYVLRTATAAFNLSATANGASGSLQTSSPGLVMIALGVTTVIFALYRTTSIGLDSEVRAPGKIAVASSDSAGPGAAPKHAEKSKSAVAPQKPTKSPGTITFPPFPVGSAELTAAQKKVLTDMAHQLAQSDANVVIQAQGDPGQSMEESIALGERRSAAIKRFMEQFQIVNRLKIDSQGKNDPDPHRGEVAIVPQK